MYLYDLNTNAPMDVPKWAKEEMARDFPELENGGTLTLRALPHRMNKQVRVSTNNKEGAGRIQLIPPPPTGHKAIGSINTPDNKVLDFRYTTVMPRMLHGMLHFQATAGVINLRDGLTVKKGQERLLFWLVYGCPVIVGNKTGRRATPLYEFDRPAVKSAERIKKVNTQAAIELFIYNTVDYSKIVEAMNILGISLEVIHGDEKGTQDTNRINLYDAMYKQGRSEQFTQSALEILGYLKAKHVDKVDESPSDLLNRLVKEDKIKYDANGWYDKDKRGDGTKWKAKPFYEFVGSDDDARFALMDFWKANTVSFDLYKTL